VYQNKGINFEILMLIKLALQIIRLSTASVSVVDMHNKHQWDGLNTSSGKKNVYSRNNRNAKVIRHCTLKEKSWSKRQLVHSMIYSQEHLTVAIFQVNLV